MAPIPLRLLNHTLVVVVLSSASVVAPVVLLLRESLGTPALVIGDGLLAIGCACLVGCAVTRCVDRAACSVWQWRLIMFAIWLFNPVLVALVGISQGNSFAATTSTTTTSGSPEDADNTEYAWAWWSGLPLTAALTLLLGRLRLAEGDPDWVQEGCPPRPALCAQWLFSRIVFIAGPMCLVSMQVCLYLPEQRMEPTGPEVGLFVCGGCIIISAKFCAMCACLARQRRAQALVLVVLLSADWISSLHLMGIVGDSEKAPLLLTCLLVAGVVQVRTALLRLCLRPRWARALARRRVDARDVGTGADVELGANINAGGVGAAGGPSLESSDSDDERGPGSLPDGFHESLVCIIGVPPPRSAGARRQFLCGLRSAVVLPPSRQEVRAAVADTVAQPAANTAAVANGSTTPEGDADASDPGVPSFVVNSADRVCAVCQEEINHGDQVRPLPKCSHIFHAGCLERWAKTMREATRCPTCRRPALARNAAEGSVSIQALTAAGDESDASSSSSIRTRRETRNSGGGGGQRRRAGPPSGARPSRPSGRPTINQARGVTARSLRTSLGISEALAFAALECSGGAPDVAAHILLEHKAILQDAFGASATAATAAPPPGVVEAFVAANPDLAGFEANISRQLGLLYRSGRLTAAPWAELRPDGQTGLFRTVLEDVVRRLEERSA